MGVDTTVYSAKKIITMNPTRRWRRMSRCVTGASSPQAAWKKSADWAQSTIEFRDKILMPGFVEGHSHIMEGMMWSLPYVGAGDRRSPEGKLVKGLADIDAIIARLRQAEAEMTDPAAPLFGWGFDPLHIGGQMLTRQHLDQVSTRRPIMVVHASFHISNVNSLLLEQAGIDRAVNISGVAMDCRRRTHRRIAGHRRPLPGVSRARQ